MGHSAYHGVLVDSAVFAQSGAGKHMAAAHNPGTVAQHAVLFDHGEGINADVSGQFGLGVHRGESRYHGLLVFGNHCRENALGNKFLSHEGLAPHHDDSTTNGLFQGEVKVKGIARNNLAFKLNLIHFEKVG